MFTNTCHGMICDMYDDADYHQEVLFYEFNSTNDILEKIITVKLLAKQYIIIT